MKKIAFLLLALAALPVYSGTFTFSDTVTLEDTASFQNGDTVFLKKTVLIDSGAVLTLRPGVVFKSSPGAGIVVFPRGKLIAKGTVDNPIIFTASADNMGSIPNIADTAALPTQGLWNGITIMGRAPVITASLVTKTLTFSPLYNDLKSQYLYSVQKALQRASFGGTDTLDSSGVIQYVSIRYAGTNLQCDRSGGSPCNAGDDAIAEYNGLALLGVGSRTVLDHIEVFKGNDWGFKFIGGSARAKYLLSAFNAAEQFITAFGFTGFGQYWYGIGNFSKTDTFSKSFEAISVFPNYNCNWSCFSNITLQGDDNSDFSLKFSNDSIVTFCNSILFGASPITFDNIYPKNPQWLLCNNLFRDPNEKDGGVSWTNIIGNPVQSYWGLENNVYPSLPTTEFQGNRDVLKGFYKGAVTNGWKGQRIPGMHIIDPRPRLEPGSPGEWDSPYGVYRVDSLKSPWFDTTGYIGAFNADSTKPMWIDTWTALFLQGYLYFPPQAVRQAAFNAQVKKSPLVVMSMANGFKVHLAEPGELKIDIFDMRGRCVTKQDQGMVQAGDHFFPSALLNLVSGFYVCRVSMPKSGFACTQLLSIVKR